MAKPEPARREREHGDPWQHRLALEAARGAHRIIAALRSDGRNELIGDFYTEWGRRFHHDHVEPVPSMAKEIATAVGAQEWAHAADDDMWGADVEASTREGQQLGAGPTSDRRSLRSASPRVGIFGPIVSPPPTGDEAVRLLEHVVATMTMPGFYEPKRGRE